MNENKEYDKLVQSLGQKISVSDRSGIKVISKMIPDSDATGELDPRVYKVQSEHAQRNIFSGTPEIIEMDTKSRVAQIRSLMGWPNIDITRTEIRTTHMKLEGRNGEIPIRIYSPASDQALPALIFFHGGGFFGGSVDCVENPCKALAEKAHAVVVSVDYRLAPEHPFPAGLYDCYDVVRWVYLYGEQIGADSTFIGVSGDSAGGNLATVCAIMDRDEGIIKYQALIYPVVDVSKSETEQFTWNIDQYRIYNHHELITNGLQKMADGSFLTELYLPERSDVTHPYVSPLLIDDMKGLPDTLIIVAEYDYLRLEAEEYARRLKRAGVRTKVIEYKGMDHAFLDKVGLYPQAEDCVSEIASGMKEAMRRMGRD